MELYPIQIDRTYLIYQLEVSFLSFRNFSYIIIDKASKKAAIVDPAWEIKKITNTLNELGAKLTSILLTHSHYDHVNMVVPLLKLFDLQVYMHSKEIEFYNFNCNHLNPIEHFETINLGQTPILCQFTPGHTVGGICFLLPNSLFTGDTIFIEGCGICNQWGGSPEKLFDSIQMIKSSVHPDVSIFPGHSYGRKPGSSLSYLLQNNIYFQFKTNQKNKFIEFRMRENQPNFLNFQ